MNFRAHWLQFVILKLRVLDVLAGCCCVHGNTRQSYWHSQVDMQDCVIANRPPSMPIAATLSGGGLKRTARK